ncbi:MAG: c-type cytochrome [Verrucomicrobiota bacterium]|jgi:DNA-binding beta-propeller fold protein YncE
MKFTFPTLLAGPAAAGLIHGLSVCAGAAPTVDSGAPEKASWLSPAALAAAPDGKTLFVACATAKQVAVFDLHSRKVLRSFAVPESPCGLALTADGSRLFVTCAAPVSSVRMLDVAGGGTRGRIATGHTAMAPVLSRDEKTLYVCCRFNDCVAVLDLQAGKEARRIPVQREPVAAAITADGRFLLVANLLHRGPADVDYVAATVSVIDTAAGKVVKELRLPNGSTALNDLRISPDGKYAVVTHQVGRFHLPASQLERGWMMTNAQTLIDLARMEVLDTVLLDTVERGAANPWGAAWPADGQTLIIAHAGTHEVSLIDFPALLAKLAHSHGPPDSTKAPEHNDAAMEPVNDLSFLAGLGQRLKLPDGDRGPRAVVVSGHTAFIANYFSDTLSLIDLAAEHRRAESLPLGPRPQMNAARKGELYFHDATLCFQGWQSCASCHPGNARVDGLNWDLLNDGIGNPKNTKSLLLAHQTPPAMSMGVRETAETAVRAGIQHILFTQQPEEVAAAIDAYLKSLKPVPSPFLVYDRRGGRLSGTALRGKRIFAGAGCAACHPPELFTDLHSYDVGTRGASDNPADIFDTPTLIEAWRTAPYLHDGSAATLREVLTTHNPHDRHGQTSKLTSQEIDDLCAYVLSL